MPDYTPFVADLDPARPKLVLRDLRDTPWPGRMLAFGESGEHEPRANYQNSLWVMAARRKRIYVCSVGVSHRRYWRRAQPGGSSPVELRCEEHEITFV